MFINHGVGSRKRPRHGFSVYVSTVKIDANGYCDSLWHNIISTSCKYAINKIPTTNYVNATLKRWGHHFLGIKGGDV